MLTNVEKTVNELVEWTRGFFGENGKGCTAVLGISGGKDSCITAALLARALGPERVLGVLMPDGVQPDLTDSEAVVAHTGIRFLTVNIGEITKILRETLAGTGSEITGDVRINIPPRVRMTVLYAVAQGLPEGGRVINTCNRSEDYIGYSTKYGDSAGDVSLLAGFTVQEVLQIGDYLGLPEHLVHKAPSDGLSGMCDEDKIGFPYAVLDRYIETGVCEDPQIRERIDRMHAANLHKVSPMPYFHPAEG